MGEEKTAFGKEKPVLGSGESKQFQERIPERKPGEAKEEYAVILDFLPNGYPYDERPMFKKSPIAQAVGKDKFTLLELVPKKDIFLQPLEDVYIGDGKRDKIHHIIGRLKFDTLTTTARKELEYVISDFVKKKESYFVGFFNTSGPLTMRMHKLELLPGLGKKKMWEIVEQRETEPFKSFADFKKRIPLMPDPIKLISKRVINELSGKEKHLLFTD